MRATKDGEFRSSVYTQRPPYADFDAPEKFQAIQSIIAKRLKEHPNAMCSYSGGSDSDIMMHMIETARKIFNLPPIKYYFFETGLEMEATRRHVRETAELFWEAKRWGYSFKRQEYHQTASVAKLGYQPDRMFG